MQPTSSFPLPFPLSFSLYFAVRKMIVSLNRRLFEISSIGGGGGRSGVHTATYTIKFNQSREICLFGQNRLTYPVQDLLKSQNGKIYPIVEISVECFPNLIRTHKDTKKNKKKKCKGKISGRSIKEKEKAIDNS